MADLLTTAENLIVAQLNAASTYTNTVSQAYRYTQQIADEAQAAVHTFMSILANTQDHPDLTALAVDSAALDSGTELTIGVLAKVGGIAGVRLSFTAGATPADNTYWTAQAIAEEDIRLYLQDQQAPPTGLGLTTPWYVYAVEAGRIYHGANKAKVRYVPDLSTRAMDVVLWKYIWGIVALALAALLPHMGEAQTAAPHYLQLAEAAIQLIAQGKPVPPLTPPKQG